MYTKEKWEKQIARECNVQSNDSFCCTFITIVGAASGVMSLTSEATEAHCVSPRCLCWCYYYWVDVAKLNVDE